MHKIVVLDGKPGYLQWDELSHLGDVVVYESHDKSKCSERLKDATIIITNKVKVNEEVLSQAPNLKFISILATGYNNIDCDAAKHRGVLVSNVPSYSTESVVQMTFALLLELSNAVGLHNHAVKNGVWNEEGVFSFWKCNLIEIHKKKLGIVGFGDIGKRVADVANAFGLDVLIAALPGRDYSNSNVKRMSFLDVLSKSDILSLHCPLSSETQNLICPETLGKMKKGSVLINTARGAIVDEQAIAKALHEGHLGGYATDVMGEEPPAPNSPLFSAPNCIITPHCAWATVESRNRLKEGVLNNIKAFVSGCPTNVVNA